MAGIGDLVANLSVNAAPWTKGFKKAEGTAESFTSSVTGSLASVGKVVAGSLLAGAAAAGVAIYAVGASIGRTAAIADKAAQTGLSGAFLQRLGYAADQSGVSAETLTKSVAKMTLVIGDAKGGSETAAKSLSKIGVSVSDLTDLSPEQQLSKIADGLGAIPDVGQRAAAAVDIFGKAGAELGPMFADGAAGLDSLLSQAAGLGIGLSDEDIAKASAADDAMQRMKATVVALIDKVSAGLAPAFTLVADAVTMVMPVVESLVSALFNGWAAIGSMVGLTMDGIVTTVVTGMSILEFAWTNFGAVVDFAMVESHVAVLAFVGGVEHFFTASMPAYLSWFGDNWRDVFMTAFDFASTIFINIGQNIRNAWKSIVDFILGRSKGLSVVWTPLMEGAVNTMKNLPDVPKRAITGLEAELRAESKVMGDALGSGLNATIEKNLAKVGEIKGMLTPNAPAMPQPDDVGVTSAKKQTAMAGALAAGSTEAYSAIAKAMGGSTSERIMKEQLATDKLILGEIRNGNRKNTAPPVVESFA